VCFEAEMSYLVLARKYRPQRFAQVLGQEHVTQTLGNAIGAGRVAHAILFAGPRGTGKTTIARILAKALNCSTGPASEPCNACPSCQEITRGNAADVFEIDGASNNSVDQVRELRDNARYMPSRSRYKIYIIDEVHMLSAAAFNALLKTLEEPPAHVLFFLATTEPHKIPITILSRCQRHDLRRVELDTLREHLATLCRLEGFALPGESLDLIAREAGGSVRDALSLLDQVLLMAGGAPSHADVVTLLGVVERQVLFSATEALLRADALAALDALDRIYDAGGDLRRFYLELLAMLRDLCVLRLDGDARRLVDRPQHEIQRLRSLATAVPAAQLSQLFDLFFSEEAAVRLAPEPRLVMELLVLRAAATPPSLPIETLIGKLDELRATLTAGGPAAAPLPAANWPAADGHPAMAVREAAPLATAPAPAAEPREDRGPWQRILEAVAQRRPSLVGALSNAGLVAGNAGVVTIELGGSDFQCSLVTRSENRDLLATICSEIYGQPLQVEFSRRKTQDDPAPVVPAQQGARLRDATLNHPLVEEALRLFDGRLVDIKVLDPQSNGGR
jgi:DNA polymerase-3 subunit gamma/tau